ncbi:MAG: amidase, partial [Bacillota bacterium]
HEFKPALNAYLSALGPGAPVHSLKEIIEFNNTHPETTLKYGQTLLTASEATSGTLTEPEYLLSRLKDIRLAGAEGIDAVMNENKLVALVAPESRGCWVGARAGYPSIIVPAGYTSAGRPMGVTFAGRAWSEGELIKVAYAFEQSTKGRRPPDLSSTVPTPGDAPPPEDW